MPSFRIYYDDGSTWDDSDGPFESAPLEGVLAVVEKRGARTTIHQGGDFYFRLEDGTVVSTDDAAALIRRLGWVKCGRWTTATKMERLHERIRAEWPD
jgi:hypothetical protein